MLFSFPRLFKGLSQVDQDGDVFGTIALSYENSVASEDFSD